MDRTRVMKVLLALIATVAALLAIDFAIVFFGGYSDPTPTPLMIVWQAGWVVLALLVVAVLVLGAFRLLRRRY